jgi:hypothetical protein
MQRESSAVSPVPSRFFFVVCCAVGPEVAYISAWGHTDYAEEVMKKYLIGAIHPDEGKARHELDTGAAPPINPR